MTYQLGILGAGNMAEAIVRGIIRSGFIAPDKIIAADVSPERRKLFEEELRVRVSTRNEQAVAESQAVLLSVKPQQMQSVLANMSGSLNPKTLLISIAAGISSKFIEKNLGPHAPWRVVRAMPNTPMLVGQGMVAISAGANALAEDMAFANKLFSAAAVVVELPEDKIDAVTAVSGSGPAYFFYLVEQMIKAGVELGLTPEDARKLAAQTALGAATMLVQSTDSPAELRRKVTSPNGTTHAAITTMESRGLGEIVVEAVKAADRRSKELGM